MSHELTPEEDAAIVARAKQMAAELDVPVAKAAAAMRGLITSGLVEMTGGTDTEAVLERLARLEDEYRQS